MKKLLSVLLVLCLMLSTVALASCGKDEPDTADSTGDGTTEAPTGTTARTDDTGTTAPNTDDNTTGTTAPAAPEVALPQEEDTQTDYHFNEPHPVY